MNCWEQRTLTSYALWPLSHIYHHFSRLRKKAYQHGLLKIQHFPVPVIVIGSPYIGGTGKTPLVIALANCLKAQGYKPAIVTRGYRGKSPIYPLSVNAHTSVYHSGDEPWLIARETGCPVIADPDRPAAITYCLQKYDCNIILSDDGLGHLAMGRAWELAVLPEKKRGNGFYFPAGCLREPLEPYETNGNAIVAGKDFIVKPECFIALHDENKQMPLDAFSGQTVHAVAGIANPARFFESLQNLQIQVNPHVFRDHHWFKKTDFDFPEKLPVIMTAKDAVKSQEFSVQDAWYLKINARLVPEFEEKFLENIQKISSCSP